ncbi:MAG: alanine--tRNA ligase [Pseudomonadota bacterium]
MLSSFEIRECFLAYFEEQGHRRVASHSLIPPADPTLLFVNAGMVQFKDVFTGLRDTEFSRAASSQKCLRVSGKHNDLENVGRTARHHTFFEMLGNFSFGDYFKKDAIRFAYEFLVDRVGLDPARLYYTIFEGDPTDGLAEDSEAAALWRETAGVDDDRILRFGKKDNFWAMGETGPCGPCSEILYDRGPGPWACGEDSCEPGCDCDRYIEIWNLVFMQYVRREAGGPLEPLPAPSIDTGMGLERLVTILQGGETNYDTDLFLPYIQRTAALLAEENGTAPAYGPPSETTVAYRVIADHARAAAFMVADQVYPDNEGRGYITRLIIRRAVRFGKIIGFKGPFLHRICDGVVDTMGSVYPDLEHRRGLIAKVVLQEEKAFGRTFEDGRQRLEREIAAVKAAGGDMVPGDVVFWLYDERGFPPDLTAVIAGDLGVTIDRAGYEAVMEVKRATSGKDGTGIGDAGEIGGSLGLGVPGEFVGYQCEGTCATSVLAILDTAGNQVTVLRESEQGYAILAKTPFYAESGGQVGDTGTITWLGGAATVSDTKKSPYGDWLHLIHVTEGELSPQLLVDTEVDTERRAAIERHHSATHLLHQALADVLGEHVKQEGSVVSPEMLRFDFRHFGVMSQEELQGIEDQVNRQIQFGQPVITEELSIQSATARGAKAFFGDKYGDTVRMVTMADGWSKELCGGTHVSDTGNIGAFVITRQEAVSSGIRRIYALAGGPAIEEFRKLRQILIGVSSHLRCSPEDIPTRVSALGATIKGLEQEMDRLQTKLLSSGPADGASDEAREIGGVAVITTLLEDQGKDGARKAADLARDRHPESLILVGARQDDRLLFVIARRGDKAAAAHCGDLCKELAEAAGARGGGRPDFAQAGGAPSDSWEMVKSLFESRAVAILGED